MRRPAGGPSWTSGSGPTAGGWPTSCAAAVVSRAEAIVEYEAAYGQFLRERPALVTFLIEVCGNVYDDNVTNVHDDDYDQPHTAMNHYQDISVRRVIAELVDDPAWPDGHRHRHRARPTSSTSGPARPTGCRGRAGSAGTGSCRSATRSRPATA